MIDFEREDKGMKVASCVAVFNIFVTLQTYFINFANIIANNGSGIKFIKPFAAFHGIAGTITFTFLPSMARTICCAATSASMTKGYLSMCGAISVLIKLTHGLMPLLFVVEHKYVIVYALLTLELR